MTSLDPYRQTEFDIRFDWGPQGADAICSGAAVAVVIDVLSFTTTLSVAADLGVDVLPYRLRDASAAAFAASRGAVLAVGRGEAGAEDVSLSPLSIRRAAAVGGPLHGGGRVVLPSPNGATVCKQLAGNVPVVVGACLRNATACARWIWLTTDGPVAVVAAGERWPDDALRPAVEDLWGAGSVIAALTDLGAASVSPEAAAARAAFGSLGSPLGALAASATGRELAAAGYQEEIAVAAEVGASAAVPVMTEDMFRAA